MMLYCRVRVLSVQKDAIVEIMAKNIHLGAHKNEITEKVLDKVFVLYTSQIYARMVEML